MTVHLPARTGTRGYPARSATASRFDSSTHRDGFDGLTLDALGGALLLEQHRRWAPHEPLLDAIARRSFGKDATVYLKRRWSGDPAERGRASWTSAKLDESTANSAATETIAASPRRGASVIAREPGPGSLAFGLWLTGEETSACFSISTDARPLAGKFRGGDAC